MIIWLASYPKSGNTWIRSFLASLLFNKNNKADLDGISNIPQYPLRSHFKNLVNNIDDIKRSTSVLFGFAAIFREILFLTTIFFILS